MVLPDFGGLQSLAAAEPDKVPTLDAALVAVKTKFASISTAPRDRTPSRPEGNQNWDGTDVSAGLSSEALGEGGSLGEGGGRPSLK